MSASYLVRPTTAGSYFNKNKTQLGSNCPTIVKHENFEPFYQQQRAPSASNLHRPMTGNPKNSRPDLLNHESFKMLTSNEMTADIRKKLRPLSSTLINSMRSDVFVKHFNEESLKNFKNVVKPVQKLDTYSIHSTLYKIKKEREELDNRIQELEATKKDFRENEICLIANSGAVDYIINLNARVNPESASNQLLQTEKYDTLNTREMKKRMMESSRQNIKAQMSLNGTMKNSLMQNQNEEGIAEDVEISGIRGTTTAQRPQTAGLRPSTAKTTQVDFRKLPKHKPPRSANRVPSFQSTGPNVNFGVTGERANIYQIYLAYNEVELKGGKKGGSTANLGRSASQRRAPPALTDQDSFENLIPSSSGRQMPPVEPAKLSNVNSPTGDNLTISTTLQAGSNRPQSATSITRSEEELEINSE